MNQWQTHIVFAVTLWIVSGFQAFAKTKPEPVISSGTHEVNKPLKVTGQTRTLNMLLTLKNKKETINFINPRQNYQREIPSTKY